MIIAHWYKLFDHLSASPQEFYRSLEQAVAERKIPALRVSRVGWLEGGLLSGRREYLRLKRERLVFDICAAPFGTGFFVSSRLIEKPLRISIIALAFLIAIFAGTARMHARLREYFEYLGLDFSRLHWVVRPTDILWVVGFLFGSIVILWLLRSLARRGHLTADAILMSIPVVNFIYERYLRSNTFYRVDTTLMFQAAVHHALMQAIDEMVKAKGVRALSDDERKPIMAQLFKG